VSRIGWSRVARDFSLVGDRYVTKEGFLVSVIEMSNDKEGDRSILGRIVLAFIGLGIAALGWALVMSVFLVFIRLPLFIFGLALAQAQKTSQGRLS
jgi:hypothetical protein